MLNRQQQLWPEVIARTFMGSCLALVLIISLMFFLPHVSAHTSRSARAFASGPTLQVNAGFNARYRDGSWVPVQITLSNNGADFSGTLLVSAPLPFNGRETTSSFYKQSITLANGAQKQVTINIPV